MRYYLAWLSSLLLQNTFYLCQPARAENAPLPDQRECKQLMISTASDGPAQSLTNLINNIRIEFSALAGNSYKLTIQTNRQFSAGWNYANVPGTLRAALAEQDVQAVLAIGPLLTREAARPDLQLARPVLALPAFDPELADLPTNWLAGTYKTNLFLSITPLKIRRDLNAFQEVFSFRHLGFCVDEIILQSRPGTTNFIRLLSDQLKTAITIIPTGPTAEETLQQLPDGCDAIYLTPAWGMSAEEWLNLIKALNTRKLPTFSMAGYADVQLGILAAATPATEDRIARRAAIILKRLADGTLENAEQNPLISMPDKVLINARTAVQIGYYPPLAILIRANFLYRNELQAGQVLTMAEALRLTVENSPEFAAKRAETDGARQDHNRSFSAFLPQVNGSAGYDQIDHDRAEASFGAQPREAVKAGASVQQMIFNDQTISQYRASGKVLQSSIAEEENMRYAVLETAAKSYIFLLQAGALYHIEANNLELTHNNLDLASSRQAAGAAGPEEIHRWEAQASAQKANLIKSSMRIEEARVALNRAIGVAQTSIWEMTDVQIASDEYYFLDRRLDGLLKTDRQLSAFENYIVELAQSNSPELKAIAMSIAAQNIIKDQLRRRRWLPEAGFFANYDRFLVRQTAETPIPDLIAPETDRNEWLFGAQATLPLFDGGNRLFEAAKARARLNQLIETRNYLRQITDQRARTVCYNLIASHANIGLQRQAETAASKTLQITRDKYSRGAVSILALLDAQNQTVVSSQNAALAVYNYLSDLITLQRIIAWFEFEQSEEDKNNWVSDFERFISRQP